MTPPAPPRLHIAPSGNACALSWPTNSPVFILQAAPSLTPPATWTTDSTLPAINGTNYVVVIQATNAARFFRLKLDE